MTRTQVARRALLAIALVASGVAVAADHIEAPGTQADPPADITDFYAWHDGGRFVVALNYAGLLSPGAAATYDPDVLYGIHIDTDPSDEEHEPDHSIWVRFGQATDGSWGVKVEGIPGESDAYIGAADASGTTDGGAMVFTGLRDDPFFFDLQGFQDTLASATLSFDSTRDAFAGTNVNSIVVEFDASALGVSQVRVWATTGRK